MPERDRCVATYDTSIILNCPFDKTYKPIFDALVLAACDRGYTPHCALEIDDAGQVRIAKIPAMVGGSLTRCNTYTALTSTPTISSRYRAGLSEKLAA